MPLPSGSPGLLLAGWLALALAMPATRVALAQAAPQRDYRLRNADPGEAAARVRKLLADLGLENEVLVDAGARRLVVRGDREVQQLAGQLIQQLDRAGGATEGEARGGKPKIQSHSVPRERIESLTQRIRKQFPQARVAADADGARLVIAAPEAEHARIERLLADELQPRRRAAGGENRNEPARLGNEVESLENVGWQGFEDPVRRIRGADVTIMPERNGEIAVVKVAGQDGDEVTMRIDRRHNQVSFEGPQESTRAYRQLARALDKPNLGKHVQLVSLRNSVQAATVQEAFQLIRQTASDLQPHQEIATYRPKDQQPRDGRRVAMIFQPRDDQEQQNQDNQPPADPQMPDDEAPQGNAGGFIGAIDIQYIEGVGFVIRGNKQDVDRVIKIIDEIIAKTKETKPDIDIMLLKFANSQAVAELVLALYDQVYGPRQSNVYVTGLGKPNAILLIGLRESIDNVKELIEKLDQPVDPNSRIKVFNLLHMSSQEAERMINSLYGGATGAGGQPGAVAIQGAGPGGAPAAAGQRGAQGNLLPRVVAVSDFRSNSLIVQASPRDLDEVASLLERLDVSQTEAMGELRVFRLRNATAQEVQQAIQQAVRGQQGAAQQGQGFGVQGFVVGGQGGQGGANSQGDVSIPLQIPSMDEQGKVKSGLLTGVTITSVPTVNAIIVRAPSASISLIEELVRQLDQTPDVEASIKVFTLVNADATRMAATLQQLFGQQVTAGQGALAQQTRALSLANLTGGLGAGESSLVPLRFSVDPRSNSVIASGSRGDLGIVELLIFRLDQSGIQSRVTEVIRLKNAPALDVATAVANYVASQQQIQNNLFLIGEGSAGEVASSQIVVVPELVTNSLIVSSSPRYYDQLRQIINDLDFRPAMVMIQVVIAQVQLDDRYELGSELGLQDALLFDRGIAAGGTTSTPGFNFNGTTPPPALPNASLASRGAVAGQALSNLGVARSSSAAGFGGLVLSAASESVNMLIRALQNEGRLHVISRPQVMALDNQQAFVQVGQTISRITGSLNNAVGGGTSTTVQDAQVGLLLTIRPRINQDGVVVLFLDTQNSALSDAGVPVAVNAAGQPIISPNINITTAQTTIMARSGQTVVFAGLIDKTRAVTVRKVPFLGDIPLLGRLFRFDSDTEQRRELLIIMTPYIVNNDEDVEWLNYVESDRMSWCLSDLVEMHGDVGLSGGHGLWGGARTPTVFPHEDPTGLRAMSAPSEALVDPTQVPQGPGINSPPDAPSYGPPLENPSGVPTPGFSSRRVPANASPRTPSATTSNPGAPVLNSPAPGQPVPVQPVPAQPVRIGGPTAQRDTTPQNPRGEYSYGPGMPPPSEAMPGRATAAAYEAPATDPRATRPRRPVRIPRVDP